MKKYTFFIIICILVYAVFSATVFAREAGFMPAMGETTAAIRGSERFVTGEDGMLHGYSFEGMILPGFPVAPADAVVSSSPILVNLTGDTAKEIAVLVRDEQQRHRLAVYSAQPRLLGSIDLPEAVYYDPVVMPGGGSQLEEILVATVAGEVFRVSFVNNELVSASILQLNSPVAISFDILNRELVVSYPQQAVVEVYVQRQNGWQRSRQLPLPVAFMQPVAFNGAVYVGVTRDNGITSISRLDGAVSAGFPIDLSSQPVGPVVVADIVPNNVGNESVVTLANGVRKIIGSDGRTVTDDTSVSFSSSGLDTVDVVTRARFSVLHTMVIRIVDDTSRRLFSYLGRLKPTVTAYNIIRDGAMEEAGLDDWSRYGAPPILEKSVQEFAGGLRGLRIQTLGTAGGVQQLRLPVDLGRYYRFSFNYKIVQGELRAFFGNNTSNAAFDGVVAIFNSPSQTWSQYERLIFIPQNVSDFRFVVSTRNADVYVDDVVLEPVENPPLVLDSDMESVALTAWLRYGAPPTFEKTTVQSALGRRSIHVATPGINGGFQQLNIPVGAGQWYRYSFDYILTRGSIRTFLGIRTSNSDFENKVAILARAGNGWQRYARDFRVPDNFTQAFNIIISSYDAEFYVDNVRIEPINAPAIVMDGDMEAPGTGSWMNYSNPGRVEKVNNVVRNGSQALYVETLPDVQPGQRKLGGAVQQLALPVTAGRRYRLSFWYRLQGTVHPRLGAGVSNEDFELRGFDAAGRPRWPRLTNAVEWAYYEREFVAPVTNDLRLVFALYDAVQFLDDAGNPIGLEDYNIGQLWLDDVRIDAL